MRVVISGDRFWNDRDYVFAVLDVFHEEHSITHLAHGAANGVDSFAGEWAKLRNIKLIQKYPAQWVQDGKFFRGAGPQRNIWMIDSVNPDLLIAIHPNIIESKGTKHAIAYAKSKGLQVVLCDGKMMHNGGAT